MKKIKGFTLSETLIVVTVLGIIGVLVIPNLVNKNRESSARTKVKKAMASYDLVIQKITMENGLRSFEALQEWSYPDGECENTRPYFNTVEGEGCTFKTSDGLWWNIQDITHPVISLNKIDWDIEGQTPDDVREKADNSDDFTAFYFVTNFDDNTGAFRVDDLEFERIRDKKSEDYKRVKKLYIYAKNVEPDGPPAYLTAYKNKSVCSNGAFKGYDENGNLAFEISKPCSVCSEVRKYDYENGKLKTKYKCDDEGENCYAAETYTYDGHGNSIQVDLCHAPDYCSGPQYYKYEYDGNGNVISKGLSCNAQRTSCSYNYTYTYDAEGRITSMNTNMPYGETPGLTTYSYDASGNLTTKYIGCDSNGENCSKSERYEYSNDNGQKTGIKYSCNGSLNNCSVSEKYKYDNNGNIISKSECTNYASNCGDTTVTEYDSVGNITRAGSHCNNNGQNCHNESIYSYDNHGNQIKANSCYMGSCNVNYTCENTYE